MIPAIRDILMAANANKIEDLPIEDVVQFLLCRGVKVGGIYRHFKGAEYEVTGLRRDCDNWPQWLVDYQEIGNVLHKASRKIENFLGDVEKPEYTGPRFVLVR